MRITAKQFASLLRSLGVPQGRADAHADAMMQTLAANGVNTPLRLGHFLAQILHESAYLRYFEEIASGRAYEGRVDLGNVIPGDGVRYKGRGPIQITGRYNYTEFQKWLDANSYSGYNVVSHPELLETAPLSWLSAIWYWTTAKKSNGRRVDLNIAADKGDTEEVLRYITKLINGGYNGYAHRRSLFIKAMAEIRRFDGFDGYQVGIEWGEKPAPSAPPAPPDEPDDWLAPLSEPAAKPKFGQITTLLARLLKREESE